VHILTPDHHGTFASGAKPLRSATLFPFASYLISCHRKGQQLRVAFARGGLLLMFGDYADTKAGI
jgi:hypothetical protein